MADFSIDYSALQTVQQQMRALADDADSGGATGAFKEMGEATASERRSALGSADLSSAFNLFYTRSSSRTNQAKDGLQQLADTFKGVSDTFFQADAQLASSGGLMGSKLGLDDWKSQKAAYDRWVSDDKAWHDYLEKIGASDYFDQHPDARIGDVCGADNPPGFCDAWQNDLDDKQVTVPDDPGTPPPEPTDDPPTSYTYEDDKGKVDVRLELDDHYDVMKETSVITTPNGQSYTSVTTYDSAPHHVDLGDDKRIDVRDYTMETTYADGSKSTAKVVNDDDGSGTMTMTDSEGNVTVSTRSGPDADWSEPVDQND
ncbi:serine/arginine repetitive matrix protein 2 [Streptomyces cyslabdanicus]|uniref:serine/arginine repetitive matrix protein 2 n=1 Tax=Streptomyces cyslabdanicus TaxID=1470456 RepID=UPI004043F834